MKEQISLESILMIHKYPSIDKNCENYIINRNSLLKLLLNNQLKSNMKKKLNNLNNKIIK